MQHLKNHCLNFGRKEKCDLLYQSKTTVLKADMIIEQKLLPKIYAIIFIF